MGPVLRYTTDHDDAKDLIWVRFSHLEANLEWIQDYKADFLDGFHCACDMEFDEDFIFWRQKFKGNYQKI